MQESSPFGSLAQKLRSLFQSQKPQPAAAPLPKTAFFHVLKTGGVTFRTILESIYGGSFQVCYDPTVKSVENLLATARCLEFHCFPFQGQMVNMHAELLREDRWDLLDGHNVFTMLREPVDQTVSLYSFLQRRKVLLEPVYKGLGLPFPQTLEEYVDGPHHFNLQTAFLADRNPLGNAKPIDAADLALAKQLLVRLKMHVGLTERFADSMNVFETVTGLTIPGHEIRNENRNPDRMPLEAISERLKDQIREQSAFDLELYEFGREIFQSDLSQCGPTREYVFINPAAGDVATVAAPAIVRTAEADETAKPAVFFHVMKTGGMTFRRILSSIYGDSFHVVDDPALESIQGALQRYECIEFHTLPYKGDFLHMHDQIARQKRWELLQGTDVFTMFREPVDQSISQFSAIQRGRHHIEPAFKANGVAFPETLEQYVETPIFFNSQLAYLAGKYPLTSGNEVTGKDLAEIKEMMMGLNVHPGLTERFSESVHIFETVTGRQVPDGKILNQNQNHGRIPLDTVSPELKARIRKQSELDIELYEFARALFMKDNAHCGPTRRYSFTGAVPVPDPALAMAEK